MVLIENGQTYETATKGEQKNALRIAKKRYLAMLMLDRANRCQCMSLKNDFDNNFAKGDDNYSTKRNGVL